MDFTTTFLSGIRIVFGFLLVLLIPGLLISLVYFPRLSDLRIVERFVYAAILSIGSVIVCVLFMDVVLGIDTTPENIVLILIVFCLVLTILWIIRSLFMTFSVTEKMSIFLKKVAGPSIRNLQRRVHGIIKRIKRYKKSIQENPDEDME